MRIAFLNQPLSPFKVPPNSSVAIWQWEVAKRLVPEHEVLIVGRREKRQPADEQFAGVHIKRLTVAKDWRGFRKLARWAEKKINAQKQAYALSYYHLDYIVQAAWAARQWGAEVIQLQNFAQFAPIVRFFNPQAKILLHMHSEWLMHLDRAALAERLRPLDSVISCCDFITQNTEARFPEYAGRFTTIFNGVDTQALAALPTPAERPQMKVLFVGRISPEKGVHVLVEAFSRVAAQFPNAHLQIIGATKQLPLDMLLGLNEDPAVKALARFYNGTEQHYYNTLQSQVQNLGLGERIKFLGPQPYDQILNFYRQADVYVQCTFWDAFPIPVVEAMAVGLPVIGSRVGGIAEAVAENSTGLLVAHNDADGLAAALAKLLASAELRAQFGRAAQQRAHTDFSWESIAARARQHYLSLMGQ